LQDFAARIDLGSTMFVRQAVIFKNRHPLTEEEFETFLWQRLSAFHVIVAEDFHWDPSVDSNPESPHFSMLLMAVLFATVFILVAMAQVIV
jgi:FPC/CPF motif-containing protein YcgG